MAGPVSSRPISGAGISHDAEDPTAQQGVFKRRYRVAISANRYPGLVDEQPEPEPMPAKNPVYDALPPESQAKVARLVVGLRLAKQRGVT